jgi:hypothetical protein
VALPPLSPINHSQWKTPRQPKRPRFWLLSLPLSHLALHLSVSLHRQRTTAIHPTINYSSPAPISTASTAPVAFLLTFPAVRLESPPCFDQLFQFSYSALPLTGTNPPPLPTHNSHHVFRSVVCSFPLLFGGHGPIEELEARAIQAGAVPVFPPDSFGAFPVSMQIAALNRIHQKLTLYPLAF